MFTLLTFLLAFSAQAFACPNLAGYYTCTTLEGSSSNVGDYSFSNFDQSKVNGLTIYEWNSFTLKADNKEYVRDSYFGPIWTQAYCESKSTLKTQIRCKSCGTIRGGSDYKWKYTWTRVKSDLIRMKTVLTLNQRGVPVRGVYYSDCVPRN